MTAEERKQYVAYRLASARNTFDAPLDWRQKGDYGNIYEYDENTVEPLFNPVAEMIDIIEKEIMA